MQVKTQAPVVGAPNTAPAAQTNTAAPPATTPAAPATLVATQDNPLAQANRAAHQAAKASAGGRTVPTLAVQAAAGNQQAAKAKMQAFTLSTYSVDDAKRVRTAFKLSSLNEAKRFIGELVLGGKEATLAAKGISPQPWDNHECYAAFRRSQYSEADVDAARKALSFLAGSSDREIKEYIGLKIVNGYETMLHEVGITDAPFDSHDKMSAFRKGGYTTADAAAAMEAFDFLKNGTLDRAKQYLGLKVINDYEEMLREVGITPSRKNFTPA